MPVVWKVDTAPDARRLDLTQYPQIQGQKWRYLPQQDFFLPFVYRFVIRFRHCNGTKCCGQRISQKAYQTCRGIVRDSDFCRLASDSNRFDRVRDGLAFLIGRSDRSHHHHRLHEKAIIQPVPDFEANRELQKWHRIYGTIVRVLALE